MTLERRYKGYACRRRKPRSSCACHRQSEESRDRWCERAGAGAPGLAVYRFQHALHGIDSFRRRREQHRNGEQDVECRGEGGAHEQSPWQCLAGVANLVADVRGNLETEQRETEEAENRNQMPVEPGGSPDEAW